MPTIAATSADSTAAFEQLARDLAAGEDVPADRVHAVVLASGKTFADLEAAADRHAADLPDGHTPSSST